MDDDKHGNAHHLAGVFVVAFLFNASFHCLGVFGRCGLEAHIQCSLKRQIREGRQGKEGLEVHRRLSYDSCMIRLGGTTEERSNIGLGHDELVISWRKQQVVWLISSGFCH